MFIDFSAFDFEKLKNKYQHDVYYAKVLDFLDKYYHSDHFHSHTSGSTGEPKLLEISNIQANESAKLSNQYFGINADTHFLLCLDIRYIGSKLMLIRAKNAQAKITIIEPSLTFYNSLLGQRFDFISLTPLHVIHILDHNPDYFQSISICLIGSSGVTADLSKRILGLKGITQFFESYAMTETISHFALKNISKREPYFKLLPGFEVSINENHCLEIYHPSIVPIKILTTDIVEILEKNELNYIGRSDNIININGLKLNPETLENEWSEFIPYRFIVAGEPEDTLGQRLILIFNSSQMIDKNTIFQLFTKAQVSKKLIPSEIFKCDKWTETDSLKPKRKEIYANRVDF